MKKKIITLTIMLAAFIGSLKAQSISMGFNYQAQIRNTAGVLIPDSTVQLRFTLLPTKNTTNAAWVETQSATTDHYGIVSVVIGNGTKTGGTYSSFDKVDFSTRDYWIKTEIKSGGSYVLLGSKERLQWVPYARYAANATLFPPGFIMPFAGDTTKIPQGWMLCDGREASRSAYSALYSTIADNWGRGNNSTTFNLPDLRGEFLRGVSYNSGVDPDTSGSSRISKNIGGNTGNNVGSYQDEMYKNHMHPMQDNGNMVCAGIGWGNVQGGNNGQAVYGGQGVIWTGHSGGSETRPKNAYVNFLIKY